MILQAQGQLFRFLVLLEAATKLPLPPQELSEASASFRSSVFDLLAPVIGKFFESKSSTLLRWTCKDFRRCFYLDRLKYMRSYHCSCLEILLSTSNR